VEYPFETCMILYYIATPAGLFGEMCLGHILYITLYKRID